MSVSARHGSLPSVTGRWLEKALVAGLVAVVLGVVLLHSGGFLPLHLAVGFLIAPVLVLGAALRPAWLIMILVAIPPGLLTFIQARPLALILGGTLLAQAAVRMRVFLGPRSGAYPLVALVLLSLAFTADVGSTAEVAGGNFRMFFVYYLLLLLVTYNAVRLGDLRVDQLVDALLLGLVGTAIFRLAEGGFAAPAFGSGDAADSLFFGRSFAFLAAMGFGMSFGRWLLGGRSILHLLLSAFFVAFVAMSLVRAAWIAVALTVLLVALISGRRSYSLLLPLALVVILIVPVASERILPQAGSSVDLTTGRGALWTLLWWDHVEPALPEGNGFGYAWSLTPDHIFGFDTFLQPERSADRFVYPHNDFLFWMIDFGIIGLILIVLFWVQLGRAVRYILRHGGTEHVYGGAVLVGVLMTGIATHLTNNTYAIRPVAERLFVVAGCLFGMRAELLSGSEESLSEDSSLTG